MELKTKDVQRQHVTIWGSNVVALIMLLIVEVLSEKTEEWAKRVIIVK